MIYSITSLSPLKCFISYRSYMFFYTYWRFLIFNSLCAVLHILDLPAVFFLFQSLFNNLFCIQILPTFLRLSFIYSFLSLTSHILFHLTVFVFILRHILIEYSSIFLIYTLLFSCIETAFFYRSLILTIA